MRFTGTIRKPGIDVKKWKARVIAEMREKLKESAIAWLKAATAPVPVWSGAALGTFQDLASEVNFTLSITPTPLGRQLGLGPSAGRSQSTGTFGGDEKAGEFYFEYSTSLRHLIFNEFNNADVTFDPQIFYRLRNKTPYRFQEKGRAAFDAVVQTVRLPSPTIKVVETRRF